MAEHCKNCGTELLAGQRFCRVCGAPVSESQREELPTKIFPGERPMTGSAPPAHTAPQQRPGTDPFSPFQQGTAPQPPAPQPHTTPLYLPPDQPLSTSRATMYLIIGMIGVTLLTVLLMAWNSHQSRQAKTTPPRPPQAESGIPVPPEPPSVGDERDANALDESNAVEGDHETTITNTYTLSSGATFSIKGVNGNVQIEGWDEAQAEVKIIKRGGSVEDRKAVQVKSSHSDKLLSFEALPTGGNGVEVQYEVRLPRNLQQVEIKTVNAGVKVADMTGAVEVKAQNASVELEDVSGATNIKLVNGHIKASYDEKLAGPQELSTVNGKIEVEMDDDIDADIDANTVSGSIELDGDFEFKVEKKIVGQGASGRVGSGGQPISIKTVNGPIIINR